VVYTASIQTHYFTHATPNNETQNTHYRNKLILKSLATEDTEPAVRVVTQHEHTIYQ